MLRPRQLRIATSSEGWSRRIRKKVDTSSREASNRLLDLALNVPLPNAKSDVTAQLLLSSAGPRYPTCFRNEEADSLALSPHAQRECEIVDVLGTDAWAPPGTSGRGRHVTVATRRGLTAQSVLAMLGSETFRVPRRACGHADARSQPPWPPGNCQLHLPHSEFLSPAASSPPGLRGHRYVPSG